MMSKTLNFLSVLFAGFVFCFVLYIGWNWFQKNQLESCVYYVNADVVEYATEISKLSSTQGKWYVLTDEEAKSVLTNKNINFDCSGISPLPNDIKERNLKIAVLKSAEHSSYRVRVWSRGFDDISGTDDDIGFPSNENISVSP